MPPNALYFLQKYLHLMRVSSFSGDADRRLELQPSFSNPLLLQTGYLNTVDINLNLFLVATASLVALWALCAMKDHMGKRYSFK